MAADWDRLGRSVAVLSVQIQHVAEDVAALEREIAAHRREHTRAAAAAVSSRRWMIGIIVAAIAAVDGPVVTLLLSHR